jgi:hypothetical protein
VQRIWGAHAPSRAHCGASPQCFGKGKVRDGEGAIGPSRTGDCTRGKRFPEEMAAILVILSRDPYYSAAITLQRDDTEAVHEVRDQRSRLQ